MMQIDAHEMYFFNAGARYSFLNDKASLSLNFNDIFNTQKFTFDTEIAISAEQERSMETSQSVYLGLSYRFGGGKNRALQRNKEMTIPPRRRNILDHLLYYLFELAKEKPQRETLRLFVFSKIASKNVIFERLLCYHFKIALAQVKPLPKAAKTTVSPSLILPSSQASVKAIGIEAAVVFPYF